MPLRAAPAAVLAALAAAIPTAAAAPAAPIASVAAPSPVTAFGNTLAWSAFDDATGQYTLMVRDGAGTRAVGVPTRRGPFDADLGPGTHGNTVLVYSRCATDPSFEQPLGYDGCRLYRVDLPHGTEHRIPVRRRRGFSDTNPAVWGGGLAWVRRADTGAGADRPQVLLGSADRVVTPRPVALVTLRRCWRNYDPSPPRICGPTSRRAVLGIDLAADGIALAESYLCPQTAKTGSGGCGGGFLQHDLLLKPFTDPSHLLGAPTRRIADTISGEGGQAWVGPSFSGHKLYFARTCLSDAGGCPHGGNRIVRYSLRTHRFTRAPGVAHLYGLAVSSGHVYQLAEPDAYRGCSLYYVPVVQRPPEQGPCTLVDAGALTFTQRRDGRTP